MSEKEHIKMLHEHIVRQQESQKTLTAVFSKNQTNLVEANTKLQQELELAHSKIDELKIQLGMVMSDSSDLRKRLDKPLSQVVHKLLRRGPYKRHKLLK